MIKMIKLNFEDIDQDILLFCAFRYALGRRTYVPSVIERIIIDNWENMPSVTREKYKREIREAIAANRAGDECDSIAWSRLLNLED
jgi:hypothetical protein